MTNVLGAFNPIFYAQEGLMLLENALGMSARVHRGFEEERRTYNQGEYIRIRKPGSFTVTDAGDETVQDVETTYVDIQLSYHKEVMFGLTDKELSYTGERIVQEHVRPAVYAIADYIDGQLALLYKDIPWYFQIGSTPGIADIAKGRRILFDNKAPLGDPAMLHMMVNGALEEAFLSSSAFTQWQGAGDTGVTAQMRGQIGQKLGFNIFANQNVQSHVAGAITDGSEDAATGTHAKGVSTITVSATSLTGTVKKGDVIEIAGDSQKYVATADATAAANAISLSIYPALAQAADGAAVTFVQTSEANNLMWHRNAFALAMAPLPDFVGHRASADVATAYDPKTGLGLRAAAWWNASAKKYYVSFDCLFGLKTLDPQLAVRAEL